MGARPCKRSLQSPPARLLGARSPRRNARHAPPITSGPKLSRLECARRSTRRAAPTARIQAYLDEDAPPNSVRPAALTVRVLSVGKTEWAAIILPDKCTYHWFDRAWHHIGVHLWACL